MSEDTTRPEDVRVTLASLNAKLDYVLQGQIQHAAEIREVRGEVRDMRRLVDSVPTVVDQKLDTKLDHFVTNDRFTPVQNLVFGVVSLILVALVGAAMTIVLRHGGVNP